MAQHDYSIANGSGAAVRSDLNNALSAIVSQNSGTTEPTTTYAYMRWADTATSVMKMRNGANNAWITLYQLDGEWSTIAFENGSASAPSIYFKDSGTDTGFYSPGANEVAVATNGTGRLFVNSSGSVGIGTSAPSFATHINAAKNTNQLFISVDASSVDDYAQIGFGIGSTSYGSLRLGFVNPAGATNTYLSFYNNNGSSNIERMRLDSSGRLGIGTTSPSYTLDARGTVASTSAGGIQTVLSFASDGIVGTVSNHSLTFFANNAERARIDTSGRLLVGTSTAQGGNPLQIESAGGGIFLRRNLPNSSIGTGNGIGLIDFGSQDGGLGARIEAVGDASWGTNDYPARLVFSTTADGASSPTERMRITQAGFLKTSNTGSYISASGTYHEIRSNYDSYEALAISHAGTSGFQYGVSITTNNDQNDATRYFLACDGATTRRAVIRSNGGLANYQANNVNLSDINTKKDISPAADTWDCIKEWEIVNYRYKDQPDDADLNLGVIAQQVAESCPEVITVFQEAKEATEDQPAQEERLGVKEQQMFWMAIKALQEAQVRIEALEAEVAALKAQ